MIAEKLKSLFSQSPSFRTLCRRLEGESVRVEGAVGSAPVFIAAALSETLMRPMLLVSPSENDAKQFYEDLCELVDPQLAAYFPALKKQLWSEIGPSRTDVGRRIEAVKRVRKNRALLIVAPVEALMEKIADPDDVELYSLTLTVGDTVPFQPFLRQLIEMGYSREERADLPGEFSVRGGIIDIYLFEENDPFRIEFFDDRIESIRRFDAETQRSISPCETVEVLSPSSAGPYASLSEASQTELPPKKSILHYLGSDCLIWLNETNLIDAAAETYQLELEAHFSRRTPDLKNDASNALRYYFDFQELQNMLAPRPKIMLSALPHSSGAVIFQTERPSHFGGKLDLFKNELDAVCRRQASPFVVMACDSEAQTRRFQDLFDEEGFPQNIHISTLNLSNGFLWPEGNTFVYTSRELYSRVRLPKLDRFERRSAPLREELSMHRGDYVVHNDYGIGIFQGLQKIKAYGSVSECLALEYQDGDRVYVPLDKMDQVQKYSAHDTAAPTLSKLGNGNWEKLKSRTHERMKEIAKDLINLYAARKAQAGYAFSEDTVWQKELEASFPFEETIDQLAAINDVKADMAKPNPMDRLVCGDVGYGKTEVAIRAAFKAVTDGKQVAVLAPTTILVQQHYTTFSERMKGFPVKIDMLSRFRSAKAQKETLAKLLSGEIDIVIGTHRLLSDDVKFKDLGLLVIDEEQRFGVMHKEKIKMKRKSVDTLLMSATPIPRTMHMAMIGARDISIINSPPNNRLPVQTEVSRFDPELIRAAILRELDRGGQVFFVHNRVESIYGIADHIRKLVPEASIAVAHGQMKPHDLEEIMLKFLSGDVQVLISTMIIENGIDMPHANTLIINRADKFGLAQLYQLRGRVGRSNRQAYAYLLIPPMRRLTPDAIRRLQTIQEYSALGAGYKIAMRDLEIRGAGNVFGAEQTGFVNALGYELYTRIIREAIREIKREQNVEPEVESKEIISETKVECSLEAYIPDDYVPSASERVDIYRRLVQATELGELEDIKLELIDRFGKIPDKVQHLFDYLSIKHLATRNRFARVVLRDHLFVGEINYHDIPATAGRTLWLNRLVKAAPDTFEVKDFKDRNVLMIELRFPRHRSTMIETKNYLQSIL